MSPLGDSLPFNVDELKKSRFRFSVTLLLFLLCSALLSCNSLFYARIKGTDLTLAISLTTVLNVLLCVSVAILFFLSIYQTFSFAWNLRFSKNFVFGYMILTLMSVQGFEGGDHSFPIFFPFGVILTLIALNFVCNDVMIDETAKKEREAKAESDPTTAALEETE